MIETYGVEQLLTDLEAYTCPVHGCEAALSGNVLMCRAHWSSLHADTKREVYEGVRRCNRLAKQYERSLEGTRERERRASEWLTADNDLREIQLRAVIVASERAGARAEPVQSARKPQPPGKGGTMKIEVVNQDGTAKVTVTHGEEQLADSVTVEPGHCAEVRLSVDTPPPVEVSAPAPIADAPAEGEQPAASEGEQAASGEGEAPADAPADGEAAGGYPADGSAPSGKQADGTPADAPAEGETPAE